jgi:hypothetical protein
VTTNPGPPERCFDGCPTNSTGNTEDCTCLSTGTAVDGDLRVRLVDAVLDVLAEEPIATQQEGSERFADVMLAMVRASREAWAIEADRLDVIATAAEYHTGPEECCDSECDHLHDDEGNFTGTDGEWCPHVEMRHATAEDAIEAHKVPLLEAQIETMDREAAADAEAYQDLLGTIWLHVAWRSITRQLTTKQRELWADAVAASGAPDVKVAADRWWRDPAPVSGSDTAGDGGDRG